MQGKFVHVTRSRVDRKKVTAGIGGNTLDGTERSSGTSIDPRAVTQRIELLDVVKNAVGDVDHPVHSNIYPGWSLELSGPRSLGTPLPDKKTVGCEFLDPVVARVRHI